jgi:hypothetical protein
METENKVKNSKATEFWKVLAILAVGIILGIFLSKNVLAYDSLKWQICGSMNITGGLCDDFWIQLKGQVTENRTIDAYNKTEMDLKLLIAANKSDVYLKSDTYNKTEIDNLVKNTTAIINETQLYESIKPKIIDAADDRYSRAGVNTKINTDNGSSNNSLLYVVIAALVIIAGFLFFKDKLIPQKRQTPYAPAVYPDRKNLMEDIKNKNREVNTEQPK